MQIYTNAAERTVTLEVPVEATADIEATVYNGTDVVYSTADVEYDDGVYSFALPFFLVQSDKVLSIKWEFPYTDSGLNYEYSDYTYVNVVTPILPLSEVKKITENDDDEEAAIVEAAVRYIIQAHTGQFFGKFVGKHRVSGSGENNLRLPSRLISLTSINDGLYMNDLLTLRGNGWFLVGRSPGVPSIRADAYGWHENPYTSDVPIYAPSRGARTLFMEHCEYTIDGVWGWNSVPPAVAQAARLLINDYACGDSNYRDRFLTSMTAADWRIQFHDGAFSNTGNVRANQLLTEFVLRRGWVVV